MNVVDFLKSQDGCSFGNITTRTNPVKVKKSRITGLTFEESFPGHTGIIKLSSRNVSLGNNYEKAVNNRIEKITESKGNFEAEKLPFGEWYNQYLIVHKEKYYIRYYYLNNNESKTIFIFENGEELTQEQLTIAMNEFFAVVKESAKQTENGLTEENQVLVNSILAENVVSISAFGQKIEN